MNQYAGSAPFVGVSAGGGAEAVALEPMTLKANEVKQQAKVTNPAGNVIEELSSEQRLKLTTYLLGRLANGAVARNRRITRFAKIDRLISTWQKLSPEDSERERIEDNTGKHMALPMNLPVLATHLSDLVSYFAEAMAPISDPFYSANGDTQVKVLLERFNKDARAQDYFSELQMTLRSLLKYNLGGFNLAWDSGIHFGRKDGDAMNVYRNLDMYNTMWDPSIRDPKKVASHGEWAATVCLENRLTIIKHALAGDWCGLDDLIEKGFEGTNRSRFYKEPAIEAQLGEEGQDTKTAAGNRGTGSVNWDSYGMGLATDMGPEVDGFEVVRMHSWICSAQFGLLTDAERKEIEGSNRIPDVFLELWEFVFVNEEVVSAKRVMELNHSLADEKMELPYYLSYLTQDQLKEAQRSYMELQKGFQRFSSAMYNIYVAGMRKNVWGLNVVDESIIDTSKMKTGDPVGIVSTKQSGRDVRAAFQTVSQNAGVDQALQSVDSALNLKDKFFPSQSMPSAVAGIDRAVSSQVATVVQGMTKSLRTVMRTLDSSLMQPCRLGSYRNLKLNEPGTLGELTDSIVAALTGSGIESLEAERISDVLWKLLMAIIQNSESMQTFNVPEILDYLSRVGNLSVTLGQFARQAPPPQQTPPQGGQPAGAPVPPQQ